MGDCGRGSVAVGAAGDRVAREDRCGNDNRTNMLLLNVASFASHVEIPTRSNSCKFSRVHLIMTLCFVLSDQAPLPRKQCVTLGIIIIITARHQHEVRPCKTTIIAPARVTTNVSHSNICQEIDAITHRPTLAITTKAYHLDLHFTPRSHGIHPAETHHGFM